MHIQALRQQFEGRKFGELVLHHHGQMDVQEALSAVMGIKEQLPTAARPLVEGWIDEMGVGSQSKEFWTQDCGAALSRITSKADTKLRAAGVIPTSDDLFNMFQIIVLSLAYSAHKSANSKAFIQKALWGWHPRQFLHLLMQPSSSFAITAICTIWGNIGHLPHLWLPFTGAIASLVTLPTHAWVVSNRVGSAAAFSIILKFLLSLVGLYALLSALACIPLAIAWLV